MKRKAKKLAKKRAKIVEKCIRDTWASLVTHLSWCYGKERKHNGNNKFHKACVKEYAATIKNLAKLY